MLEGRKEWRNDGRKGKRKKINVGRKERTKVDAN